MIIAVKLTYVMIAILHAWGDQLVERGKGNLFLQIPTQKYKLIGTSYSIVIKLKTTLGIFLIYFPITNSLLANLTYSLFTYFREYEEHVNNQTKGRKWKKAKTLSHDFSEWFKERASHEDVPKQLKDLSRGPNTVAKRFSSYVINGYKFQTREHDASHTTQNSGVTLVCETPSFASAKDNNPMTKAVTYFGAINDIIELDYYACFKFVLFNCDWFEVEEENFGLTSVHFNKRCSRDDPFILASQVHQCFYIQDPFNKDKHYVMDTVPRDLFNMYDGYDVEAEESNQKDPFDQVNNLFVPKDNCEVQWTREDMPNTIIEKPSLVLQQAEYDDDSDL